MFNAREIVRKNNATFYDFNTRQRRSQKPRGMLTLAVAAATAVLCPSVSDNLLAGFLAVQSILLGFTFNVMFFLIGNREREVVRRASLEAQLRSEKVNTLYHELFFNVSYFNLIAVASIIVATALLLPTPEIPPFARALNPIEYYIFWLNTAETPRVLQAVTRGIGLFVFYALSIEVVYSISRVIGRTSFYFERKMAETKQLSPGDNEPE